MTENTPLNYTTPAQSPYWERGFDRYFQGDRTIWLIIVFLVVLSVLLVYSATGSIAYKNLEAPENYLLKHFFHLFLALGAVWVAHRVDYRYYSRLSRLALLISVPLLIIAWKFGANINEASRWIFIPYTRVSFQPSDLAKLALISSIAGMLSKRQENVDDFQETILPIIIWTGIICTLIGLANVSNAVLLFFTSLLLMFIGRIPTSQLMLFILTGFVSLLMALYLGQRLGTFQSRMDDFFNTTEIHFQQEQSYIAISGGGLLGKGPGNSDQRNFLPNPFSDYIYAIILEEYGLLGGLLVLGLYLLLLYRGIAIMANSSNAFGGILAAGLSFSLVIQAMLNICVAVGLLPITGVPLPLLSMGGTSLLFTGIALGIILSVSRGDVSKEAILENSTIGNTPKVV